MKIARVLVANRGEIAVRIIRACQALGIETALAVSVADRASLPARMADRVICVGPAQPAESYLNVRALVTAALATEADTMHPGYGFLAESVDLAQACNDHGITFVGPLPEQLREMGNKLRARALARQWGVPTLPGSQKVESGSAAAAAAEQIGYPVILKAAAGGGGRGMKVVGDARELRDLFASAAAEARGAFGDGTLYLERYISNARHVEIQILGDRFGNVVHLGERDCSLQRRHQKLVEEAPAPGIPEALREQIRLAGTTLARNIGYQNAGTVEFILDQDTGQFYFLEMNTRIQVEHPVSEAITGIDLVQEQLRVAGGDALRFSQADVVFRGHAIECRINAELAEKGFQPNPGRIEEWQPPEGPNIRVDSHCYAGYQIPIFYDSMLAKLIVYGIDRAEAVARMRRALEQFRVAGVGTTVPFLRFVMGDANFTAGRVSTRLLEQLVSEISAGTEGAMQSEGRDRLDLASTAA